MTNTGSGIFRAALLATSSLVAASGLSPALAGGPYGGRVVVGNATITDPNAYETLISQSSGKALIDWSSFSIPSNWTVDFKQPNSSSLTVNVVTGPDASQIDGKLLANGAVWLLNSNGILFGRGSEVNVGSLLATTSDISDSDFEKGRYSFTKGSNPNASVVNQGTIKTATGGSVVLSASEVSNQGLIQANLGKVVLGGASAFSVDMNGDNLIRYQITGAVTQAPKGADGKTDAALVSNSGTISAAGGSVLMTANAAKSVQDDVINNTGMIEATSASSHDGEIVLDAGTNGTVDAGGTLDASGTSAGQTGGQIELTGNTVNVENGARLDASGYAGGGTVLIGGGFHGKGPIADAEYTNVGNATIDVSATGKGNGGKVAVWSNKQTLFAGQIDTQGGAYGGNGGYVETSSAVSLEIAFDAVVNASAPHGSKGSWLLDPLNIIIETGGTTKLDNGVLGLNQDQGKTDTIDPNTIIAALKTTNVLLEAANDITILSDLIYSSMNSLLLLAEHDINAFANVQNSMASGGGGVYLIAGWNGTTTNISQLTDPGVYGNNGGSVFIGTVNAPGNVAVGSASGPTVAAGDNVTVEADNGYAQLGYAGAGNGDITVDATGNITVADLYDETAGIEPDAQIGNGGVNESSKVGGNITLNAGGDITILDDSYASDVNCNYCNLGVSIVGNMGGPNSSGNVDISAGGDLNLTAEGIISVAQIGNIDLTNNNGGLTGNITITANDVSLLADGEYEGRATIGQDWDFAMTGLTGGNIDITANALTLEADGSLALDQARITNRGAGDVFGNVDVNISGDISLIGNGSATVTEIGDASACGNTVCYGTTSGNTTVDAGGSITILAENGGNARIEDGGGAGNDISVTAGGDITIETTGSGGSAFIGAFVSGSGGGDNIDVTSTGGAVQLIADAPGSFAFIGSSPNGYDAATSGNITVSAATDVSLSTSGSGAHAQIGNYNPYTSATVAGNITITAGDAIDIGGQSLIGNTGSAGDVTGSVTLTAPQMHGFISSFYNDIPNGNFTLDFTGTQSETDSSPVSYNSPYTLSIISGGNLTFDDSLVNTGSGAIDITSAGTITIGGSGASGNVDVGSRYGATMIDATNLILAADNGYAQLGFNGSGTGAIDVTTTGDVTLDGGGGTGDFAQIGDGGYQTSGKDTASITIKSGGNLTLSAGRGQFAYAQIGNGGAEADANSAGYNNSGMIDVSATNIVLDAGSGLAAYAQIGNGGYEVGKGLTGNGTNSGDITITAVDSITLDGNGGDAYAQIGNGGDLVNVDATSSASGGDTGNVDVTVTGKNGTIVLAAGNGADSYVQIGDGGYAENTPNGNASNFTTGGDVTVTVADLTLTGGNSGNDAYAQIGNGDASAAGIADIIGTVTVNGNNTETNGSSTGSEALIGNDTGTGTVNGTQSGNGQNSGTSGTESTLIQSDQGTNNDLILAIFQPPDIQQPELETEVSAGDILSAPLTPLEQMANSSSNGDTSYEGSEPSDRLVASLGQSLDPGRGRKKNSYAVVRTLVPGVLKQIVSYTSRNPRGVPPADEDYSSWGNKALWR